jgi:hypothetical protein
LLRVLLVVLFSTAFLYSIAFYIPACRVSNSFSAFKHTFPGPAKPSQNISTPHFSTDIALPVSLTKSDLLEFLSRPDPIRGPDVSLLSFPVFIDPAPPRS